MHHLLIFEYGASNVRVHILRILYWNLSWPSRYLVDGRLMQGHFFLSGAMNVLLIANWGILEYESFLYILKSKLYCQWQNVFVYFPPAM